MAFMISLKCCQLSEIGIHINSYSALKTSNIVQLFAEMEVVLIMTQLIS